MAKLRIGKPDATPDAPAHTPGVKQGNSHGQLREAGRATCPTAARPPSARPASTRRRASRSTRGCRTCRPPRPWMSLPPVAPAGAGPGAAPSPSRTRRRSSTPRCRRCASRCASTAPAASRSARCCSTRRSRSPRAGARYDDGRAASGCSSCSAPPADWGTTLRTLLWTRTTLVVPPFTRRHARRPAVPCTYDLEVVGVALLRRARGRRGAARVPVQRQRLLRGRGRAAADGADRRGSARPRTGCRCAVWRETMERYFRGTAWVRLRKDALRPARRVQGARTRCRRWEDALDALLAEEASRDGDPVPRDRRRRALRGLRAVALPALGAEEPAPLDVRRRVPARARRGATRDDRGVDADASACSRARRGRVDVRVRFLHVVDRQVRRADGASRSTSCRRRRAPLPWEEAVEREVGPGADRDRRPAREREERGERRGAIGALVGRRSRAPSRWRAEPLADGLQRMTVEIANTTPLGRRRRARRRCARTFCSTHTVLRGERRRVRLAHRPARAPARRRRPRARTTAPGRCWSASGRARHAALLADHPRGPPADRAREPGRPVRRRRDRPAAVLNILSLTDEEKAEMRASDPRAREILERTEALTPEAAACACTARSASSDDAAMSYWEELERPAPDAVTVDGVELRARQPRAAAAAARAATSSTSRSPGATGVVEGIEQDIEGKVQLAVVVDDDPGRDLGERRQPGHRFFFSPDEVEPLGRRGRGPRPARPGRRDRQRVPRRRRLRRRARRAGSRGARCPRASRSSTSASAAWTSPTRCRTATTRSCCSTRRRAAARPGRCT